MKRDMVKVDVTLGDFELAGGRLVYQRNGLGDGFHAFMHNTHLFKNLRHLLCNAR